MALFSLCDFFCIGFMSGVPTVRPALVQRNLVRSTCQSMYVCCSAASAHGAKRKPVSTIEPVVVQLIQALSNSIAAPLHAAACRSSDKVACIWCQHSRIRARRKLRPQETRHRTCPCDQMGTWCFMFHSALWHDIDNERPDNERIGVMVLSRMQLCGTAPAHPRPII